MHSESPMARITVFTRSHRYCGLVETRGYRVADLLNDGNTAVLPTKDVAIADNRKREAEFHCEELLLRKRDILVALLSGEHEAPVRRNNNRTPRRHYGAVILLPGLAISGIAHMPGRVLPQTLVQDGSILPPFLAVTNVDFHSSVYEGLPAETTLAVVQRECIEAYQLSEEAVMV